MVERAVGEDHGVFQQPVGIDGIEQGGHRHILLFLGRWGSGMRRGATSPCFRRGGPRAGPCNARIGARVSDPRQPSGPGAAFFGQEHIRLHLPDAGQGHDPAAQNPLEIGQVTGDDAQAVVIEAQHMLDRLHLGNGGNRALEILRG